MEIKCTDCSQYRTCPTKKPGTDSCLKLLGYQSKGNSNSEEYSQTADRNGKLLKYLEDAILLERNLYTQRLAISDFDEITSKNKPVLNLLPSPAMPTSTSLGHMEFQPHPGRFALCAVACILWFLASVHSGTSGGPSVPILLFLIISGCLCIIPTLNALRKVHHNNTLVEKQLSTAYIQYQEELERIKKNNNALTTQYNIDKNKWSTSRSNTLAYMQKKINETQTVLSKLYQKNIIYAKYQNLAALTSIYEYLKTGRCYELTGPFGAYNLYESELRNDLIIAKLDIIISNLQRIQHNQFMLYQQLTTVQKDISLIRSDLTSIKTYTYEIAYLSHLNAYYNGITASNTALIASYGLY